MKATNKDVLRSLWREVRCWIGEKLIELGMAIIPFPFDSHINLGYISYLFARMKYLAKEIDDVENERSKLAKEIDDAENERSKTEY